MMKPTQFCKRAILTIAIAAVITLLLTPFMNSVEVGSYGSGRFLDGYVGTWYISEYFGFSREGLGLNSILDSEGRKNPKVARFLENAKKRVQPYLATPGAYYDVVLIVPKCRARGWPCESRALCGWILIEEHAAGNVQQHILLADENGEPPERPAGRLANWLFYAAISMLMSWIIVRFTPIHELRFNLAVLRGPAIGFLRIERRWHWRFIAALALLLGCMGACYTHTKVITFERAPFTGQFDDVYLNAMMGLPSDYLPEELDPLSGIIPADPQLIAFCEKLADQARPYVKDHPDQCTVYVMLTSHTVRGWPFRSSIPAATLIINDESSGGSYGLEYKFEVDAEGNPAFKWPGAMGNTLVFAAVAFPLAWGCFTLLAWILNRLTRLPHAFPVVITNGEQAKEEA